ncbi:hypothetical protein CBOM_01075 [Ceraceosorus bombacis]|uniref:Uncharacterized protein n=1 Tax=Ceraceosorus bombacis TaxID=401625 RepID=A0A0P1BB18_9BASI|nr:hypothetical protein CBOM_01075 [Ceraceosorus bombacis]
MATSPTLQSLDARVCNLTDKIKVPDYESRAPLSMTAGQLSRIEEFLLGEVTESEFAAVEGIAPIVVTIIKIKAHLRRLLLFVGHAHENGDSNDADEDGDSDDGYASLWNQLNLDMVHLNDKDRAFIQEFERPWTGISQCHRFEHWSRKILRGVQEKQRSIAGDARIRDESVRSFLLSTAFEDEMSVRHHIQVNTERRAELQHYLEEHFVQLAEPCVQAMEELVDSFHVLDSDSEEELWRIGGNVLDARLRFGDRMWST